MRTNTFYSICYNNGHTDDGMVLNQSSSLYLHLENAIKCEEKLQVDYITPDGKLHLYDDDKNKYKIIKDPSKYYSCVDGSYLEVDIITETKLSFNDVDDSKSITIEVDD